MRREDLHSHDHISNLSGYHECVCTARHYAEKLKEFGSTALCITNHGSILGWFKAYEAAKEHGLKYIHATEAYCVDDYSDKSRGYHIVLIAKNQKGFIELNSLMSKTSKRDGEYYYNPRLCVDDVFNTSDNIIILSACLGGILAKPWRANNEESDEFYTKVLRFFIDNRERCYLEIQPHPSEDQVDWNREIYDLSITHNLKVVATLDAHASSEEREETRKVLKKSKGNEYEDEDKYKSYLRPYDEVLNDFVTSEVLSGKEDSVLTEQWYQDAIKMSNEIVDMCEEIYVDTDIKYPHMSENSQEAEAKVRKIIQNGIRAKGYSNLPKEKKKEYSDRLKHELKTFRAIDCWDYFLLEDEVKSFARSQGIAFGTRGSASASAACFFMDISRIDPIKSELPFARFMDVARPGAPDIDSDFEPHRRQEIIDYLHNHKTINSAHIMAFTSLKIKSAINLLGKGVDIDFKDTQKITKDIDDAGHFKNESMWREKYPELFKHVDRVTEKDYETIVSMSVHPCGHIVSSQDIESEIGYYYTVDNKTKLVQRCIVLDMDAIEVTGHTKLDLLAVDAYASIHNTCKLVGIDFEEMMPENMRQHEDKFEIWDEIRKDTVGIFQFSKPAGQAFLPRLLSDSSIARIKHNSPDVPIMDLVSFASAAIRPAGNTFREDVADGHIIDHGHAGLNDLLKSTMGAMVYQETIMEFLHKFTGQSMGESYKTLKAISKKRKKVLVEVEDQLKKGLVELLVKDGVALDKAKKTAEDLMNALIAATGYGFSRCHSLPYAYLAFAQGYLRYNYPLEFYAATLNAADGDEKKTQPLIQSATKRGFNINKPIFGKSSIGYTINKEENCIYRGVDTIKHLKEPQAIYLQEKQSANYESFDDFMLDLFDPELYAELKGIEAIDIPKKKPLNSTQVSILIDIGFFDCFQGDLKACLKAYTDGARGNGKYGKKDSRATKIKKIEGAKEELSNEFKFSPRERLLSELKYLDTPYFIDNALPTTLFVVSNIIKEGWDISYEIYQPKTGRKFRAKVDKSLGFSIKPELFLKVTKFRHETTPSKSRLIRITEGEII